MHHLTVLAPAATHQTYAALLRVAGPSATHRDDVERDRGAVSLEQVLWFVAAGVSVAVVAAVLWNKIFDEANKDITDPSAPSD
jgi:hypothetical protein